MDSDVVFGDFELDIWNRAQNFEKITLKTRHTKFEFEEPQLVFEDVHNTPRIRKYQCGKHTSRDKKNEESENFFIMSIPKLSFLSLLS